jgi:hypothetical protein
LAAGQRLLPRLRPIVNEAQSIHEIAESAGILKFVRPPSGEENNNPKLNTNQIRNSACPEFCADVCRNGKDLLKLLACLILKLFGGFLGGRAAL